MKRVFVTRRALPGDGLRRLDGVAQVVAWNQDRPPSRAELIASARDADALICMASERIDADILDTCTRLRVVANLGVGYNNLDLGALTQRSIPAGNTPGVLAETTADHAWALILAACRRVAEADRLVRSGKWRSFEFDLLLGQDVHGATLGIVGYGAIGQAVAKRARGFGMRVLHHSRQPRSDEFSTWASLLELVSNSDIITIHVPLTEETRNLISQREFEAMKRTAVLVNTARGPVVDQTVLVAALRERRIFAAGLDVYETEPIPDGDPILDLDNCVLSPHIGSGSAQTRAKMVDLAVANVMAGLEGKRLPYCINPEVYV